MNKNIVIKLKNISKTYRIYNKPQDRFYSSIANVLQSNNAASKYYKELHALKNVSLDIYRGETIGIIGRNGSGKSTLLQIVASILAVSDGEVEVFGKVSALLELGAGFNPEYSGRENIITNGSILGLSQSEIENKIPEIIEFSELEDYIDHTIKTYSSGMYVRLAFAIAIHTNPDILIIDEALAVGDEAFQRKCFAKIRSFQENGGTILFVSHNSSLMMELCSRVLLLENGQEIIVGPPKNVITCYQKLIYANPDDENEILDEIKSENNNYNSKSINDEIEIHYSQTESYDPTLISKSTIEYKNHGVLIENAQIKTIENKVVNILIPRNEYLFTYDVKFTKDAHLVRFGMLLKTITGLELGGATNTKTNNILTKIDANSNITIVFKFKCLLSCGTYFLNAGVTSSAEGNETFLARTIDILAFKVQENDTANNTGTVDFLVSSELIYN